MSAAGVAYASKAALIAKIKALRENQENHERLLYEMQKDLDATTTSGWADPTAKETD